MEKSKKGLTVKWAISILIPVLILLTPTNELYTSEIRMYLALSLWMILAVALELFDSVFIPAFMLPVLWYITGTVPLNIAYASWTQEILFVIIGAFLLASILEHVGLLQRIAYWCILRFGGTFKGTYWGIAAACALVSLATFCNAYIVLAAVCYGICRAFNLGKSRAAALLTMSALVGTQTGRLFIYSPQTVGLIELGVRAVSPDYVLPWYKFMWDMLPNVLMCIVILIVYGKIFGLKKVDVNFGKEYFVEQYQKLGKMSSTEKKSAVILAILILFILTSPIHGLSANYGFLVLPIFFFLPGLKVATAETVRNCDFPMIFFVSSCLGIGLVGEYLGLGTLVTTYLTPIMNSLNLTGTLYIMLIFGVLINFILTPTAMMAAFPATISALALSLNVDPLALIYPFEISTDLILLPYEYVPYLVFFSFGTVSMGDFVKFSAVKMIIAFLFLGLIMVPWWKLIGIL